MKSNINFSVRTYWIKISIAFLICILFLSLPSCEEKKTPEEILIGIWNIESERTIEYLIEYLDEIKTDDNTFNYNPNEGAIQFLEEGIGKVYKDGVVVDTYTWSEKNFVNDYDSLRSEGTFSWQIVEDYLIIGLINSIGQDADLNVSFTVSESNLTLRYISYEGPYIIAKSIPGDLGPKVWIKRILYLTR